MAHKFTTLKVCNLKVCIEGTFCNHNIILDTEDLTSHVPLWAPEVRTHTQTHTYFKVLGQYSSWMGTRAPQGVGCTCSPIRRGLASHNPAPSESPASSNGSPSQSLCVQAGFPTLFQQYRFLLSSSHGFPKPAHWGPTLLQTSQSALNGFKTCISLLCCWSATLLSLIIPHLATSFCKHETISLFWKCMYSAILTTYATYHPKYSTNVNSLSSHDNLWCIWPYVTEALFRSLRHRDVKLLIQGHTASEWQGWDLNQSSYYLTSNKIPAAKCFDMWWYLMIKKILATFNQIKTFF